MKNRATISYIVGGKYECRKTTWSVENTNDGVICRGNPSLSEKVTEYMVSLKRRKIQAGEISVSEKALSAEDLAKLYRYNNQRVDQGDTYDKLYYLQLNVRFSSRFGSLN